MDLTIFQQFHPAQEFVYAALFLGMFLEANVTILTGTFFISRGSLNPFLAIIVIIFGAFSEQFLLFWAGEHLGRSEKITKLVSRLTDRYDQHLISRTFHSLLLSKFIYGLHRAVLVRIGMLHIGWKKFTRATLASTSLWLLSVGSLGFVFSASYGVLKHNIKFAELILLSIVIFIFILDYFISKRLKQNL